MADGRMYGGRILTAIGCFFFCSTLSRLRRSLHGVSSHGTPPSTESDTYSRAAHTDIEG